MQQVAGRAERQRKELTLAGAPAADIAAATALARRTREEAAQAYDELMRRRLEQSATSGAAARWESLHSRCAERLLAMLLANGGLYVKLGQHLAQLDYLVPEAYTRTLGAVLFTANTASSWADAAAVIEAELGMPPEKAFASIERVPIASASLAQVHVATERGTGRKLAVKVQHAGLREACHADLAAVGLAVRCAERWFPEFCLGWVVDEIAPHLPLELDFLHEAQNLERCRRLFAASPLGRDGTVVLPDVVPHLTTTRVLTMSFEEGDSVADVGCLRRRGLAPAAVARVLSEAFCTMLFQGGLVHCDPHPGNVLVRAKADGRPQLVLLDHGLYRELTPHFRLSYCRLWRALVTGDADAIRAECDGWAIGEYYPLLAAMLTARPWADITSGEVERLRERGTAQDKESIRGYAKLYMRQIAIVFGRLPREMLLLAEDERLPPPCGSTPRRADQLVPDHAPLLSADAPRRRRVAPRAAAAPARDLFAAPRVERRAAPPRREALARRSRLALVSNFRWLAVAPSLRRRQLLLHRALAQQTHGVASRHLRRRLCRRRLLVRVVVRASTRTSLWRVSWVIAAGVFGFGGAASWAVAVTVWAVDVGAPPC